MTNLELNLFEIYYFIFHIISSYYLGMAMMQ